MRKALKVVKAVIGLVLTAFIAVQLYVIFSPKKAICKIVERSLEGVHCNFENNSLWISASSYFQEELDPRAVATALGLVVYDFVVKIGKGFDNIVIDDSKAYWVLSKEKLELCARLQDYGNFVTCIMNSIDVIGKGN